MAGRAGLGLRQFERRFVQQVGASPKLFSHDQQGSGYAGHDDEAA
jgi:hypothetical protein